MDKDWQVVGGITKLGDISVCTESLSLPEGTLFRTVTNTGQVSTTFVPRLQNSAMIGWHTPTDALPLDEVEVLKSPWEGAPSGRNA